MSPMTIRLARWMRVFALSIALALTTACCGEDKSSASDEASEKAEDQALTRDEMKALSSELDIKADETIDESNLRQEVDKLEAEIKKDL